MESEEVKINYIIAVPMYRTIQQKIATQKTWLTIEDGIAIAEFEYQTKDWLKPRRMITVHQVISKCPNSVGKQLSLFTESIEIND